MPLTVQVKTKGEKKNERTQRKVDYGKTYSTGT